MCVKSGDVCTVDMFASGRYSKTLEAYSVLKVCGTVHVDIGLGRVV